jgi:TPP-dependent pyruvate/acetoin dehydrogenase alpha subunit
MPLTNERRQDLLRRILEIRRFEESVKQQLRAGLIPGSVHLSIGHEGAIAGGCAALEESDYVIGTHRSHGHPIAKGAALGPLMAELMGREGGVCKGKGGSMHLTDHAVGVMGESGIVGGGLPLAAGAGLSAKVLGNGRVCLCFFGDGASNEGSFHESLNLAAIWKLPVVYLCENNLYGATTPACNVVSVEDIADRAAGYGIPGVVVDGQDAEAVFAVSEEAVARARAGDGPSLIEAKTYRYGEHAEGLIIPVSYRDEEEVEAWRRRDPLEILRARLIAENVLAEDEVAALDSDAQERVAAAVAFAKSSPMPEPQAAFEDIYSNPLEGSAR